jgi:hypothetical protein
MNVIEQFFYDIELEKEDELGKELLEIIKDETVKKHVKVMIHQVIKLDHFRYTVIVNHVELN